MPRKISKEKAAVTEAILATVQQTEKIANTELPSGKQTFDKTKEYWHNLGPGLTTGASDDDPSGIATYSQTGAQFGFQLMWMSFLTLPLMAAVQEMCARIGMVTGRGLASVIRIHFPRKVLYICTISLFAANAFNIGADLGAMAKGAQLIRPNFNYPLLIIGFTLISVLLQILTPYDRYARYLKWLALVLLAYIASAIMAHLNWGDVFKHALVPTIQFRKDQILLICAILGTTISPYLFFWQTSQEVEQGIMEGKKSIVSRQESLHRREVHAMRIDVWSGMFLSNLVMFFIVAACGALLFGHGITQITSAAQAAEALRPFAGSSTYPLFATGIIGTGLLAIPVLAGASSYAFAETFKLHEGLYRKFRQAHAFYGVIIVSMLVGLGLNFVGLDPIKALIYSAMFNGIVAPIVLALIVLISSNQKIMGKWVNKKSTTWLGWAVVFVMTLAGLAAIWSLF